MEDKSGHQKPLRQTSNTAADIAKTYHDISKGDYISRLVEEKKRQEQNAVKKKSR